MSKIESPAPDSKECTVCKKTHALHFFYKKGERYEALCKACKKESRNASYQQQKLASQSEAAPSALVSDSEEKSDVSSENMPQRPNRVHIEPESDTTYEMWEKKQGKPLTMREKIEIKMNLTEFFKLLITEAKLQKVGSYGV